MLDGSNELERMSVVWEVVMWTYDWAIAANRPMPDNPLVLHVHHVPDNIPRHDFIMLYPGWLVHKSIIRVAEILNGKRTSPVTTCYVAIPKKELSINPFAEYFVMICVCLWRHYIIISRDDDSTCYTMDQVGLVCTGVLKCGLINTYW
jgi:hypothetical protein